MGGNGVDETTPDALLSVSGVFEMQKMSSGGKIYEHWTSQPPYSPTEAPWL